MYIKTETKGITKLKRKGETSLQDQIFIFLKVFLTVELSIHVYPVRHRQQQKETVEGGHRVVM